MTGHQPHPGTGKRALGGDSIALDIETLLRACGVEHVARVNPFDFEKSVRAMKEAVAYEGPSDTRSRVRPA